MEQSHDRIDFKHIYEGVLKVLNLERGLLLTIKEMVICPGQVIQTYLSGEDRKKYTHPIQYVVMLVGAYYFLFALLPLDMMDFQAGMMEGINTSASSGDMTEEELSKAVEFGQEASGFIFKYLNVITFLMIPLTAVVTYFLYRKAKFYYAEHLVVNAYITGTYSILGVLSFPLYFISFSTAIYSTVPLFAYQIWAYMDIFQERNLKGVIKGSLVTILAFLFAMIFAFFAMIIFAIFKIKNGG